MCALMRLGLWVRVHIKRKRLVANENPFNRCSKVPIISTGIMSGSAIVRGARSHPDATQKALDIPAGNSERR